jgi:hypothetical protein
VDEYGDPVQNISVRPEPVDSGAGRSILHGQTLQSTDDHGEFHILTGPGRYYLKAVVEGQQFGGKLEIRTDGTAGGPFVTTFYPNAPNAGTASAIQVEAGQDLSGIEIRQLRSGTGAASRLFTVSGVVTGIPEHGQALVMFLFGERPDAYFNSRAMQTAPDGGFHFTAMQAAYYRVSAANLAGKTPLRSFPMDFHLDAADRTGLVLALAPPEELTGKLEVLGDAPAGRAEKQTVRLEQAGWHDFFGEANPAADVAPDGSFHIAGVPPSQFTPVVAPMPENGYLKEVDLDNKTLPDEVLDFTHGVGGSRLKIVVSRNGGWISGRVLDKDGGSYAGPAMVFLGVDARHLNRVQTSDGNFSFKAIRPGQYRLVAVDFSTMTSLYNLNDKHDDLMKRVFDAAQEIGKIPEKKEAR